MTFQLSDRISLWIKGLAAAAISGAANGVITGLAAVGIDPQRFNLQSGIKPTLTLASVSALMSAMIGTSAYLKQSPLPTDDLPPSYDGGSERRDSDPRRNDHSDERTDAADRGVDGRDHHDDRNSRDVRDGEHGDARENDRAH